jgi:hypothetical protein
VGAAFGGCCQPWRSAVSRVVERIGRAKELDALIMIFERQLGDELVWAGQHLDERSRVPLMGKGLEGAQESSRYPVAMMTRVRFEATGPRS